MVFQLSATISGGGKVRHDESAPKGIAVLVASNIAEGSQRHGTREFLQFLGVASGSLAETETFLILGAGTGDGDARTDQTLALKTGGRSTDAQRTRTLAALQKLSDADFPLSLTS